MGISERRPAEAVVVLAVEIGGEIDAIPAPVLACSVLTVGVDPAHVIADRQPLDVEIEVVESDGEMPLVPSRRLEVGAGGAQDSDAYERQDFEADERWLLGKFRRA